MATRCTPVRKNDGSTRTVGIGDNLRRVYLKAIDYHHKRVTICNGLRRIGNGKRCKRWMCGEYPIDLIYCWKKECFEQPKSLPIIKFCSQKFFRSRMLYILEWRHMADGDLNMPSLSHCQKLLQFGFDSSGWKIKHDKGWRSCLALWPWVRFWIARQSAGVFNHNWRRRSKI